MVGYKTIESGPGRPERHSDVDFRDPAGPNRPENELIGQMYIGDNIADDFPLQVSAAEGSNRVWRYTSLPATSPQARTAAVGTTLVGWEWDARVDERPRAGRRADARLLAGDRQPPPGQRRRQYASAPRRRTATIYRAASGA